jgi:hypothetical protein
MLHKDRRDAGQKLARYIDQRGVIKLGLPLGDVLLTFPANGIPTLATWPNVAQTHLVRYVCVLLARIYLDEVAGAVKEF